MRSDARPEPRQESPPGKIPQKVRHNACRDPLRSGKTAFPAAASVPVPAAETRSCLRHGFIRQTPPAEPQQKTGTAKISCTTGKASVPTPAAEVRELPAARLYSANAACGATAKNRNSENQLHDRKSIRSHTRSGSPGAACSTALLGKHLPRTRGKNPGTAKVSCTTGKASAPAPAAKTRSCLRHGFIRRTPPAHPTAEKSARRDRQAAADSLPAR